MPAGKALEAIICDPDPWSLRALAPLIEAAGFSVVGETANAIQAIRQAEYLHPSLVVIAHELPGLSGLEAIADLRTGDDPPEVLLVSFVSDASHRAKELGAFELAVKGEVDMLERMLLEVRELIETGERRKPQERRTGVIRRLAQDWSRVTHERRAGDERRGKLRREIDIASRARWARRTQLAPRHADGEMA